VSPQIYNEELFLRLATDPKPFITFTGRRAYRVKSISHHEVRPSDGWLAVFCVPAELFGMYGKEDDEAYRQWIDNGNGADPFHDGVLADSYILQTTYDAVTYFATCVRCRNPGKLNDMLSLEIGL
jgi:hypothetical protein